MVCEEDVEEALSFLRRRLCAASWGQGGNDVALPLLPDVEKICRCVFPMPFGLNAHFALHWVISVLVALRDELCRLVLLMQDIVVSVLVVELLDVELRIITCFAVWCSLAVNS